MGVRVGILFLVVLGISWACVDARTLMLSDLSVMQISYEEPKSKIQASTIAATDERVCTLCEEFTAEALEYLNENKTQRQIIDDLHLTCHKFLSFKQQCIMVVDYYAPLFFMEIGVIQPEDFCRKMDLCDQVLISSPEQKQDGCTLCHHTVEEILAKLKDPDTQLDIIELLLKGCDAVESYVKEDAISQILQNIYSVSTNRDPLQPCSWHLSLPSLCKKLVFEYGPLLMDNAEQFLEMTDICTVLHACKSSATGVGEAFSHVETSMLSES